MKWERGGEKAGKKRGGGGGCHGDKAKRVRFYASGLVTNIRLNCCCARVRRAEGHLTSIAGGNRRLIQLNLFAISVRLAVRLAQPLPKLSKQEKEKENQNVTLATSHCQMAGPER